MIQLNCVSPATVATPFVERMLQGFADQVAERAALDARQATGRMVEPTEVAEAVLYMLTRPRNVTIRDIIVLPTNFDI